MRRVFQYAVLCAVPRAHRGESINVGVILYCQDTDFLEAALHLDVDRLRALDPDVDVEAVQQALDAVRRTCAGEGPAASTSLGQRFRWLTSPRSTVVRSTVAHSGFTTDTSAELERLLDALVR